MENEVFIEKCNKIWRTNDWGFYCHNCSLQDFIVICSDCFEKSKHFGHEVETIVCEAGVWCDCGNEANMKSDGFCAKHTVHQLVTKSFDRNQRRSLKSSSSSKTRKISEYMSTRRGSEGFFDGILNHLFAAKPLELSEFYDLNKVSKYSLDGILLTKYFDRSKAHYLEHELKLKRIFEINKFNNKYPNDFENKKRMLLWYSVDNTKGNESLTRILNNGISYEKANMGRALYFRDRIKRFVKYANNDFGLLLLCEVAVGNMYRVFEKKHFNEVPFGFDSLKCVGKYCPDKTKSKIVGTGIIVPKGKTVLNESVAENKTDFDINQFIVFEKSQLIVRYLVQYYEQQK